MNFSAHWTRNGLIAALVILTGLFLFYNRDNSAVPVRLVKVERANLVSNLSTNGKVEPLDPQELRALLPGFVQNIAVKEGEHVKRGQVLVRLDRGEAVAEVARAEAALQSALAEMENVQRGGSAAENNELENQIQKARAERDEAARLLAGSERLLKVNAVPKMQVDEEREKLQQVERDLSYLEQRRARRYGERDREQAQAHVTDARAALDLARTHLASATAAAPVEGTVYSLPARAGNFINRGELLAKVADLTKLRVKVYVDEPELGRLAPQQEILVTWDAQPGATWKGRVERLPAEVTQLGTRSVGQVDCIIENPDQKLLPNINVNVEIITRRSGSALTVAKEAVLYDTAQSGPAVRYVFVYDDGKIRRHDITVGIATATRVEIRSGLNEGQSVAVAAADAKLADGLRVRVTGESQ
jgi:HlyD family secretion protein